MYSDERARRAEFSAALIKVSALACRRTFPAYTPRHTKLAWAILARAAARALPTLWRGGALTARAAPGLAGRIGPAFAAIPETGAALRTVSAGGRMAESAAVAAAGRGAVVPALRSGVNPLGATAGGAAAANTYAGMAGPVGFGRAVPTSPWGLGIGSSARPVAAGAGLAARIGRHATFGNATTAGLVGYSLWPAGKATGEAAAGGLYTGAGASVGRGGAGASKGGTWLDAAGRRPAGGWSWEGPLKSYG